MLSPGNCQEDSLAKPFKEVSGGVTLPQGILGRQPEFSAKVPGGEGVVARFFFSKKEGSNLHLTGFQFHTLESKSECADLIAFQCICMLSSLHVDIYFSVLVCFRRFFV